MMASSPIRSPEEYSDMIHLSRPPSQRPKMSPEKRAAQFAPFAALSGHGELIAELERQVDSKIELDEAGKAELDLKITQLLANSSHPEITLTHFVPDLRKDGGKYQHYTGIIQKVNTTGKYLLFQDGTRIAFDDIFDIQ